MARGLIKRVDAEGVAVEADAKFWAACWLCGAAGHKKRDCGLRSEASTARRSAAQARRDKDEAGGGELRVGRKRVALWADVGGRVSAEGFVHMREARQEAVARKTERSLRKLQRRQCRLASRVELHGGAREDSSQFEPQ